MNAIKRMGHHTLALLAVVSLTDAAQEDWCDPGWNTFTTTCFKLFTEPKSWSAAQTYCEEMDGNLLSVNAKPGLVGYQISSLWAFKAFIGEQTCIFPLLSS